MLKTIETTTLIAALIFVAGLFVLMFFYASPAPPTQSPQQQHSEKNESKKDNGETDKSIWEKTTTDPVAFFTMFLVIFTAVLSGVAAIQLKLLGRAETVAEKTAQAAKESAEVARQSLVTVQRAFVFIDSFQANIMHNDLLVAPKWRNSGTTPTRFMTNWVNWMHFISEPQDDFTFPDLDESGNPVDEKDKKLQLGFVGPNATAFAHILTIPTSVVDEMRAGHVHVFIWGWTKYQDVFKANHVTKFCNEIKIIATWSEGEKDVGAFTFPSYRRHNCTDDECEGEK